MRIFDKIIWGIISIASFSLHAQNEPSEPSFFPINSTDYGMAKEISILNKQVANDKQLKLLEEITRQVKLQSKVLNSLPDTNCLITIPIVFHVFHPDGENGVPLSQIDYAIADLNANFAGSDNDYKTVNSIFDSVKSYTRIRFKRALIDPKGRATIGVVYYKDKQSGFGNGGGYDAQIASCAWDNFKYFNVYLMNDLYANNTLNNSGVCWYPSEYMSKIGTARMVYNYVYFGKGGSSYNNLEFNQTFTHELGHYLNLRHTFDGNDCNSEGDLCDDTPPTNVAAAGCVASPCAVPINGENYMDYNATCYKNFTKDQNARMEVALLDPSRFSLWQPENLIATGIISNKNFKPCINDDMFLAFSKNIIWESIDNNGTLELPNIVIHACAGAVFKSTNKVLKSDIDYSIKNLPEGLTAKVFVENDSLTANLVIEGKAIKHEKVNSIDSIEIKFFDSAFNNSKANEIRNYKFKFAINLLDPWKKTCEAPNIQVTPSASWKYFETQGPIPRYYGLWYNSGSYYLENYGRGIITESLNSDKIVFLPEGTEIGINSGWRAGGNQGILYSSSYNYLDSKTGIVGFRLQAANDFYYGWMKIKVSSTEGVTLLEYHYNNKPNESIIAGSSCESSVDVAEQNNYIINIYPNPATEYINIELDEEYNYLQIMNQLGEIVVKKELSSGLQNIDISNLPIGIYIVNISNIKGAISRKIVKE